MLSKAYFEIVYGHVLVKMASFYGNKKNHMLNLLKMPGSTFRTTNKIVTLFMILLLLFARQNEKKQKHILIYLQLSWSSSHSGAYVN